MDILGNKDTGTLLELPITLRTMLGQLIDNNNLVGWNVFADRHNKICCNIRFDIGQSEHGGGSSAVDLGQTSLPCVYRKVSPRQQVRARERLNKYKSFNPTMPKEIIINRTVSMITQSKNENVIA